MSIALVLGSGGHTSEILKIISNLPDHIKDPLNHLIIYSSGDTLSLSKYKSIFFKAPAEIKLIPRARRVGQSYFTSIFHTIYSLMSCIFLFIKSKPKIVINLLFCILLSVEFRLFVTGQPFRLQLL